MPRHTVLRAAAAIAGVTLAAVALTACQTGGAPDESAAPASEWVTDGRFTVGTGEPAYFPWVIDDAPESGEGFEAAVAYAVAAELGFAAEDVVWVRTTFDEAIAPGPKNFDVNLQQFSITDERKEAVDFSSPYYETTQVVITTEASAAAGATSLADLKPLLVGAQTGTTSFTAAEEIIAPDAGVQVFNSNEDAKLALESGQIDALVVDLPTAFYIAGVELDAGRILGQLPGSAGGADAFGLVLPKDSPLTAKVTAAVDALRDDGTLAEIEQEWLAEFAGAPVLP
jgi:polar amino acid transport system substrate-binding protein